MISNVNSNPIFFCCQRLYNYFTDGFSFFFYTAYAGYFYLGAAAKYKKKTYKLYDPDRSNVCVNKQSDERHSVSELSLLVYCFFYLIFNELIHFKVLNVYGSLRKLFLAAKLALTQVNKRKHPIKINWSHG